MIGATGRARLANVCKSVIQWPHYEMLLNLQPILGGTVMAWMIAIVALGFVMTALTLAELRQP